MSEILIKNMIKQIILEELSLKKEEEGKFPEKFINNLIDKLKEYDSSNLEEGALESAIDFFKPPYSNLEKILIAGILYTSASGINFINSTDILSPGQTQAAKKINNNIGKFNSPQEYLQNFYKEASNEKLASKKEINRLAIAIKELIKVGSLSGEHSGDREETVKKVVLPNSPFEQSKEFYKQFEEFYQSGKKIKIKKFNELLEEIKQLVNSSDHEKLYLLGKANPLDEAYTDFVTNLKEAVTYLAQSVIKKDSEAAFKERQTLVSDLSVISKELYDKYEKDEHEDGDYEDGDYEDGDYEDGEELQNIIDGVDGDSDEELEYDEDEEDLEDDEEVDVFEDLDDDDDLNGLETEDGEIMPPSEAADLYLEFYNEGQSDEFRMSKSEFREFIDNDPEAFNDILDIYRSNILKK